MNSTRAYAQLRRAELIQIGTAGGLDGRGSFHCRLAR
jgi:hypothetical protein